MPQQVFARIAVVGAVLVGVLVLCGLAVQQLAEPIESPGARAIECTEADHRLAEQLARDRVLTSPQSGTTLHRVDQAPCGDESDDWGRVSADISLPPGTSLEPVIDHYRTLLTAGHWRIALEPGGWNLLCADRTTNGQQVRLLLGYGRATPGPRTYGELTIDISFKPGGEDLRCHS
ncbi:hypothetical protein KBX37_06215 [Micromonospora sp. U56]|uniref:hypothetical protein n=1 Tax=Micromonospora sp. U56 TaxID=2824900 RepID=UPI001B35F134|nr:hypothetical protein [Micromonospora sp. U56]MBQ0892702.1 hypothetical protein [Micromonospora sp. U56]